jgi:hypothetical protein
LQSSDHQNPRQAKSGDNDVNKIGFPESMPQEKYLKVSCEAQIAKIQEKQNQETMMPITAKQSPKQWVLKVSARELVSLITFRDNSDEGRGSTQGKDTAYVTGEIKQMSQVKFQQPTSQTQRVLNC